MSIPLHVLQRMEVAEAQFHSNDAFTSLEVDADSLIYKVAATTKTLEAAKRRFVQEALTLHYLAASDTTSLHLTPKHCSKAGRFNINAVKPYQGNRTNAKKPQLVEPLRYVVGRERLVLPPEITIVFNDVYEADDSVVMACHKDTNAIFYSEDKDLNCLTNRKLCHKESIVLPQITGLGWLSLVELSHSKKVDGRGPIFFWAQMLMGDQADGVKGLTKWDGKLSGPVKTYELLQQFLQPQTDLSLPANCLATFTEKDIAKYVLSGYMRNKQNPISEGYLLWLYRSESYDFITHLHTLGLFHDEDIGKWLLTMLRDDWYERGSEIESVLGAWTKRQLRRLRGDMDL
ncbi:hypothetical protein [Proteus mirabilis]|uniref:hypothetical protein n=1 Tax=Proteus mirabilis TaxID=584 RepID=UPI0034D3E941